MNMNRGQKIFIRLRPKHDLNSFLPLEESLVGTLLHEFTHNVHGPHDKNFYAFLDKLQDEYDELRSKGYSGEGFLSDGSRMGGSHNLSPHEARAKALAEAERRNKLAKLMGPPGGRTLGGGASRNAGKSTRELAADAAERRAKDAKSCGHGEAVSDAVIAEEAKKAEDDSLGAKGVDGELAEQANVSGNAIASKSTASTSGSNRPASEDSDSDIELIGPPPKKLAIASNGLVESSTAASRKGGRAVPGPNKASGPASEFWACSTCTFENGKPLALACEMCGSERSGGSSSSQFEDTYKNDPYYTLQPQQKMTTVTGW